jgi:hypothetical protein
MAAKSWWVLPSESNILHYINLQSIFSLSLLSLVSICVQNAWHHNLSTPLSYTAFYAALSISTASASGAGPSGAAASSQLEALAPSEPAAEGSIYGQPELYEAAFSFRNFKDEVSNLWSHAC